MKYRLKKDTPEFKAGKMFTRGENEHDNDCLYAAGEPAPSFEINLINNFDEWFEEVKKPEWVRKQIKNIKYRYKGCFEVIKFRYIKDFYVCSFDSRSNEEVSKWNKGFEDEFDIYEGRYSSAEKLSYLNQLVRDGYIEIEDNPNIVWEDEKCD